MSRGSIIASNKIWAGYSAFPSRRVLRGRVGGDPGEIRAAQLAGPDGAAADGANDGRRADRRRGFGLAVATHAFLRVSGCARIASRNGASRNAAETHAFPPVFGCRSSNRQLAARADRADAPRVADLRGGRPKGAFPLSPTRLQPTPRRARADRIFGEIALSPIGGPTAPGFRAQTSRTQFGSGWGMHDLCENSARAARQGEVPAGRGGLVHQLLSDGAKGATLCASGNRVN
jgi:hypothetical protein